MRFIFLSHASSGKWRKEVPTPGDTPSMNSALGFTATPFLAEIHTRSGRIASDWVTPTRLLKILDPAHTVRCSPLKVCTDSWSAKPVCLAATPISPPPHQVWRRRGSGQLGQAQLAIHSVFHQHPECLLLCAWPLGGWISYLEWFPPFRVLELEFPLQGHC